MNVTTAPVQIGFCEAVIVIPGETTGFTVKTTFALVALTGEAHGALEVSTHHTESWSASEVVP